MSYTEALSRVSQIESEIEALGGVKAKTASTGTSSTSFADTLAHAQGSDQASGPGLEATPAALDLQDPTALDGNATTQNLDNPLSGTSSYYPATYLPGAYEASTISSSAAPGSLTAAQRQFASRLSEDTGLNSQVVSAWLLAEESGGAAAAREAESNNDWLNVGYTDSATYGGGDAAWSSPIAAAEATASWLSGHEAIPGYGTASPGVQAILSTAGQAPEAQIAAIQSSGWASSGYPDLPALFQQVSQ